MIFTHLVPFIMTGLFVASCSSSQRGPIQKAPCAAGCKASEERMAADKDPAPSTDESSQAPKPVTSPKEADKGTPSLERSPQVPSAPQTPDSDNQKPSMPQTNPTVFAPQKPIVAPAPPVVAFPPIAWFPQPPPPGPVTPIYPVIRPPEWTPGFPIDDSQPWREEEPRRLSLTWKLVKSPLTGDIVAAVKPNHGEIPDSISYKYLQNERDEEQSEIQVQVNVIWQGLECTAAAILTDNELNGHHLENEATCREETL